MKLNLILFALTGGIRVNKEKLPRLYIKVSNTEYTSAAILKDFANLYKTQCIDKLFSVIQCLLAINNKLVLHGLIHQNACLLR